MKKSNNETAVHVLFEHKFGFNHFLSNLREAEIVINKIAQDWNSLELDAFDSECLKNLYKPEYFSNRYTEKINDKINKLNIPYLLKDKLFANLTTSEGYKSLFNRLESLSSKWNRFGRVAMNGGVRVFNFDLEFFEVKDGVVSLIPDIEEKAIIPFRIVGDTPEKIAAFEKLNEAANCLNELTLMLEETGLFSIQDTPIIEQSPLFYLEAGKYRVRHEILI